MSEDVESTEDDVVEPDVVADEEVVPERQYATVDDVKQWEKDRAENAEDFEVPGTGKWFKIAPVDMNTLYKMSAAQIDGMGQDGDKVVFLEVMGDAVVQSAVVLPALDDAAVAALRGADNALYQAVLAKCQEVSHMDDLAQGMESFS